MPHGLLQLYQLRFQYVHPKFGKTCIAEKLSDNTCHFKKGKVKKFLKPPQFTTNYKRKDTQLISKAMTYSSTFV